LAVTQPNHPYNVNIYAGLARFGITDEHVVAGTTGYSSPHKNTQGGQAKNISACEYKEVLTKTLLPKGRRWFTTAGVSTCWFHQDNDPTQKVAADFIDEYNKAYRRSVQMPPNWPPSSPDFNLIEKIWASMCKPW